MAVFGQFALDYAKSLRSGTIYESMDYVPDFTVQESAVLMQAVEYSRIMNESFSYDPVKQEACVLLMEAGISSIFEAIKKALISLKDFVAKMVRKVITFFTGLFTGKKSSSEVDKDKSSGGESKESKKFLLPDKSGTLPVYNEENMKKALDEIPDVLFLYKPGAWRNIIKTDITGSESSIRNILSFMDKNLPESAKKYLRNEKMDNEEQLELELGKMLYDLAGTIFTPQLMSHAKTLVGNEFTSESMKKIAALVKQLDNVPSAEEGAKIISNFAQKMGIDFAITTDPKASYNLINNYNTKDLKVSIKAIESLGDQAEGLCKKLIPEFDNTLKKLQKVAHPDSNIGNEEVAGEIIKQVNKVRDIVNNYSTYITAGTAMACKVETQNASFINRLMRSYIRLSGGEE